MEVQDQESLGRWDGLGSRDASSRSAAMEHIGQEVMKKVEAIGPIPASPLLPPALGSLPNSDLNDILAHLLMLSRRCPFEDVKERCIRLLKAVQLSSSDQAYIHREAQLVSPTHPENVEEGGRRKGEWCVKRGGEAVDNTNKVLQQEVGRE
eukprot:superscaffoldBa00001340_g10133